MSHARPAPPNPRPSSCLNHRLRGLKDCADVPSQPSRRCVLRTNCILHPYSILALCPLLYSRLSSAFRFFFIGPVGYVSVCSVLCPSPYSRLSSAFNPLICVIRDSDNLPTPFALLSPFIRLSLFLFWPCGLRLCLLCALSSALLSPFFSPLPSPVSPFIPSRLSSAFNPLICVIRDSDKFSTPSALLSPFFSPLPSPLSPFIPSRLSSAFHLR